MVEDHEDLDHPFHDIDLDSVMFWLIGGLGAGDSHLGDVDFAVFGHFCIQDIQAFGGN